MAYEQQLDPYGTYIGPVFDVPQQFNGWVKPIEDAAIFAGMAYQNPTVQQPMITPPRKIAGYLPQFTEPVTRNPGEFRPSGGYTGPSSTTADAVAKQIDLELNQRAARELIELGIEPTPQNRVVLMESYTTPRTTAPTSGFKIMDAIKANPGAYGKAVAGTLGGTGAILGASYLAGRGAQDLARESGASDVTQQVAGNLGSWGVGSAANIGLAAKSAGSALGRLNIPLAAGIGAYDAYRVASEYGNAMGAMDQQALASGAALFQNAVLNNMKVKGLNHDDAVKLASYQYPQAAQMAGFTPIGSRPVVNVSLTPTPTPEFMQTDYPPGIRTESPVASAVQSAQAPVQSAPTRQWGIQQVPGYSLVTSIGSGGQRVYRYVPNQQPQQSGVTGGYWTSMLARLGQNPQAAADMSPTVLQMAVSGAAQEKQMERQNRIDDQNAKIIQSRQENVDLQNQRRDRNEILNSAMAGVPIAEIESTYGPLDPALKSTAVKKLNDLNDKYQDALKWANDLSAKQKELTKLQAIESAPAVTSWGKTVKKAVSKPLLEIAAKQKEIADAQEIGIKKQFIGLDGAPIVKYSPRYDKDGNVISEGAVPSAANSTASTPSVIWDWSKSGSNLQRVK